MNRFRHAVLILGVAAAVVAHASAAFAQRDRRNDVDDPNAPRDKDPLRGSIFIFDQAMSTQTAHLEPTPEQSYVPFYGWWLSLRPRWNFSDKLRVQARFDYYKEFTNSQDTTYYREDVFDDIWTDVVYSTPLADSGAWKNTKLTLTGRAIWPTSKASQGEGIYVTLGAGAGLRQTIPLRGPDANSFGSARASLAFTYLHPFSNATTATNYGDFSYSRENVDGFSFQSDQLSGQTLVEHKFYGILDLGLEITPKIDLSLDWILVNEWHYSPTSGTVSTLTGPATPQAIPDQQFTQLGWFVVSADYDVIPEMSLSLGYYNLANTIAPDGTARTFFGAGEDNLLWSPDARVFFDVTANLDRIFEDATGKYKANAGQTGSTSEAARTARIQSITNQMR